MTDSQDAFVILPFEDEFEQLYDEKIVPILESQGYSVNKADSIDSQRAIIEDIINGITNADLIIADLTGTNPNVFYELGIAHGLGVPTVLIAQDIDELPFDLAAYKTIEYSLLFNEIGEFEEELSSIGENHFSGNIEFGSPVSDYGEVEIASSSSQPHEENDLPNPSGSSDEVVEDEDKLEKGVLEFISEIDDKMAELENIFENIEDKSDDFGYEITNHVKEIEEVSTMESRASHKRANQIARNMADSISTYSDSIENQIDPIDKRLTFMMDGIQSFIKFSDVSEEEHRQMLNDLYSELDQFILEMETTTGEISQFQEEMSNLRGLNRELDHSINNLTTCLSNLESILNEGIAKAERFMSLIDNDLEE
ncbi:hypothetical protein [Haladaptatus sp. DYF46]|uniref:hypothetical protein n=1 Tax=Haladaptatus sp. DYF46 TaxID=2886041 RepID=UPI001E3E4812|nr:hypothetical protein [Haladaptatus sp. DYF46]